MTHRCNDDGSVFDMMAEPTFTVYIRLPVLRGDFVDPPPIDWDTSKDDKLWSIISTAAKTEIDWEELATRFDVTVAFLLQQVAYLTERHTAQLRAQVRKATAAAKVNPSSSAAPSPVPGAEPSVAAAHNRTASALSNRRDSLLVKPGDGSTTGSGTPTASYLRPNVSRNISSNTAINQAATGTGTGTGTSSASRPAHKSLPFREDGLTGSAGSRPATNTPTDRRRLTSLPIEPTRGGEPEAPTTGRPRYEGDEKDNEENEDGDDTSSYESSDSESVPAQSRIIRRPPRYQPPARDTGPGDLGDDEDETDGEPAFAAEAATPTATQPQDLNSTLRGGLRPGAAVSRSGSKRGGSSKGKSKAAMHRSETSDSSPTSSPAFAPGRGLAQGQGAGTKQQQTGEPLSPRRTGGAAGDTGKSPRGSEGTPSMGSSFSDLDDASVTQSALEEALASKMQDGAMGSRFSISQAFRSRYLPGGQQR